MYSKIMKAIKAHLETKVNAAAFQVGYYGDMSQVDLRVAAVLLEPILQRSKAKDTRWRAGEFQIRLWVLVEISRDYMASMDELEAILGAEDASPAEIVGIQAALLKLNTDPFFKALTGKIGGKSWRIRADAMEIEDTRFGIVMRSSERVNAAQVDIKINLDIER